MERAINMRKIFFGALSILSITLAVFLFTQRPGVTEEPSSAVIEDRFSSLNNVKMAKGEVESVLGSSIVISDDNNGELVFLIKPTTVVYGPDWQAVAADKIKSEDAVKIKYLTTKDGLNEALSINLLRES